MNKYTLFFKDSSIERNFQIQSNSNVSIPTFKFCGFGALLYYIISLTIQLIDMNIQKIIFRAIEIALLTMTLIIVHNNKNQVKKGLFVLNVLIALFEYEYDDSYDQLNYYFYGTNCMLIHTIMMFSQSFLYGVVSNFIIFIVRLTVTVYHTEIILMQVFIAIITTFGFVFILYQSEKFQRQSFLLTLKDNSWEIMLPLILTKPFLMFSFDIDSFSYQLRMMNRLSFPFEEQNTVHQFLKDSKYGNSSLQEFIYFKIITSDPKPFPPFLQDIWINFKKKKIQILLSGCFIGQPNFILVLQSEDKEIKQLEQKFKAQHNTYFKFFQDHIKQTCYYLKTSIEQNQIHQITKLLISHKQSLLFKNFKCEKYQHVNISALIEKQATFLNRLKYKISYRKNNEICIRTIRPCLLNFLYEIFKSFNFQNNYSIKAFYSNKQFIISFIGIEELPQTSVFDFCSKCLISQIIQIDNSVQFIFYENPLTSYCQVSNLKILNPYE